MKNRKVKQSLLALACAFTVMSAGLSVRAAETVGVDDAYLSARYTGSCGCVMRIETMSQRSCTDNGNGTHTAVYNTTYVCDHDIVNRTETIKESHVFSGKYNNEGHQFYQGRDTNKHLYTRSCRCGAIQSLSLDCHAGSNVGGHAQP